MLLTVSVIATSFVVAAFDRGSLVNTWQIRPGVGLSIFFQITEGVLVNPLAWSMAIASAGDFLVTSGMIAANVPSLGCSVTL